MPIICVTTLCRSLSVFTLATAIAFPVVAIADRDQKCVDDCRQMGYQWSFCDSKCSYNNSQQGGLGGLDGLGKAFSTQGLAAGYMQGAEAGSRQALIQQQIENQRLQNEILRRQLEGSGTSRPPQSSGTPQYDRIKAAEPGDSVALTTLGIKYAKGDGVPKDSARAVELFRRAVEKGSVSAINNLGWMYANGEGVSQSDWHARDLYRVAADRGSVQAHVNMGNAYEMGSLGVSKNLNEALAWYRKAANLGHEESKQKIAVIEQTVNQSGPTPQSSATVGIKLHSEEIKQGAEVDGTENALYEAFRQARRQAANQGCDIESTAVAPQKSSVNYGINCSDSSIHIYKCNGSNCNFVYVLSPEGEQTTSK